MNIIYNSYDFINKFVVNQYKLTSINSFIMFIFVILLFLIYFQTTNVINLFILQGGELLVNKPVHTDLQYSLGSFQKLNGINDYQFAISFWIFIDSASPNTNASYSKFTSLLNFGEKPNILYNGKTHTFMIIMKQTNLNKISKNQLIEFDENDNRIIYKNKNILLQKWNNVIINYNSGILDIFLNSELVKSEIGIIPYLKIDNLTIGEDNGIKGGICNVVYFRQSLKAANIYYLYNMVKKKTPPVLSDSNETIMIKDINKIF